MFCLMIFDFRRSTFLAGATPAADEQEHASGVEQEIICLFDQLRNPLLRYLSSFGIAHPDSEEIIQEAFLLLFRHLQAGKSRENLHGWLFRVVHNLGLKLRHEVRRDSDTRVSACDLVTDRSLNPEDQLASAQTKRQLLSLIEALPEQDRRCLFLRAEGLRYRGIAEVLDISIGAVSQSLARSLARIARAGRHYKL